MVADFLSHLLKRFTRSVSFGKETATQVILGFFALVIVAYAVAFGFGLENIIVKVFKQQDAIGFLNGLLIYYFIFEFMLRFFLQSLPVLHVQPYLHLPIARSRIVHFLLGRSLLHVANIFVFFLFAPFAFTSIANGHDMPTAWRWLITIWFLSLANHFVVILFKKKFDDSIWGLAILLALFGGFAAIDYFNWFKVSDISKAIFQATLDGQIVLGAIAFLLTALYIFNYRFFLQGLYPEEISLKQTGGFRSAGFAFLDNFGLTGEWINIELKLILRNKRTRNILFFSTFFLLYGLMFYNNEKHISGIQLLMGVFITGAFTMNYGQFLFSWQGSHFDFTLTQPISINQFVESKYYLLAAGTIICFLLTIPYAFFGWRILLIQMAAASFNLGINIFVIMNMAMWEPNKVDLSKGSAFNYEGVGAAQWLMGIPILAGPYIFYLPFSFMGYPNIGLMAVALAGLFGIVFHKQLIQFTANRLISKRHVIASNFRKD